MDAESLKKDVGAAIDAMSAELLGLSHAIHGEPELALEEFKAAKRLSDAVESHGIQVQREAFGLKTAFAAEFGKAAGPNVAILSEYDALPGIGHACGHNIIATSAYGAAMALAKLNGRLPGRVREGGCGDDDASLQPQHRDHAVHRDLGSGSCVSRAFGARLGDALSRAERA